MSWVDLVNAVLHIETNDYLAADKKGQLDVEGLGMLQIWDSNV